MKKLITFSTIVFISVSAQCGSINWTVSANTLNRILLPFESQGNVLSTTARSGVEVYLLFAENLTPAVNAYGSETFSSLVLGSETTSNNGGLIDKKDLHDSTNTIMVEGTYRNFAAIAFITIDASNAKDMLVDTINSDDYYKYYGTYYTQIGILNQLIGPSDNIQSIAFAGGVANNNLTGGWVMIPEPATAGLALAGLALLFRRKRK